MDIWIVRGDDVIEDVGNFPGRPPRWLRSLNGKPADKAAAVTASSEVAQAVRHAAARQIERFGDGLQIKVIDDA